MIDFTTGLRDSELIDLADALRSGRLRPPFASVSLQRVVARENVTSTASGLEALYGAGATPAVIAMMLDAVAGERRSRRPSVEDAVDLVTSGPEASGVTTRDTSVVVRELFANAQTSVLIVGYAVYQGQRVFASLADRMSERPGLDVEMFLDIQRPPADSSAPSELVRRFAQRFVTTQWPTDRPLPTVYYYPPSLELEATMRSSLHAKCVVIDGRVAFVSSANFTEAAQERNVEVGVLIRSEALAAGITRHFDGLIAGGLAAELPLPVR